MCRVLLLLLRYWVVVRAVASMVVTHASLEVLVLMVRVHHDHCSVALACT